MQSERLGALGELASGIAHDINNARSPAALLAFDHLLSKPPDVEELRKAIAELTARAGHPGQKAFGR